MCTGSHPFIPASNTARLEMVYSSFGQIVENVLHVRNTAGWDIPSLTALASAAADAWFNQFAAAAPTTLTLTKVKATDLENDPAVGIEFSPTTNNTGSNMAAGLPNNVTVSVKFTSGLTGRSSRGRAYYIGLREDQVVGNALTGTHATDIATNFQNFFADIDDLVPGTEPVIVSYCSEGVWRTTAQVLDVLNISVDPNVDSQRRRLNGRGT